LNEDNNVDLIKIVITYPLPAQISPVLRELYSSSLLTMKSNK